MSLERLFKVGFNGITVSAVQDLLNVTASSTNGVEVRRISLSASGVTAAAEIVIRLKRMAATVTAGSGGSAGTIYKVSSRNDKAALSSTRTNDTTQATSSGATDALAHWNWNVLQDFLEVPPTEGERWECTESEAIVLDIITAPASTVLSGFIVFKET